MIDLCRQNPGKICANITQERRKGCFLFLCYICMINNVKYEDITTEIR